MSINNSRAPSPLSFSLVTIALFTMNGVWTEWGGERGGKGISGSSICFALLSLWIYFCTIYFDFCIKRNIVCVCVTHTHWCSICVPVCVCPRVCVPAFPLPSVSLFINDKLSYSATKLLLLLLLLRQNVLRMFARLPIRSLPLSHFHVCFVLSLSRHSFIAAQAPRYPCESPCPCLCVCVCFWLYSRTHTRMGDSHTHTGKTGAGARGSKTW